jgi:flagellar assembly protein FliH
MLSKVLRCGDASNVQLLVFPSLAGYRTGADVHASLEGSLDRSGNNEQNDTNTSLRQELHQLEAQAATERREAFEAGKNQGEQQARAELQPVMERLNSSIAQVLAMRSDLRQRAERDVVQLALMIAKRILHRQLSVDEEALSAIARVAFERLTRSESYRITVHPKFAAAVTSAVPGSYSARFQIDPDPNCEPGTLIIHSAEGIIDASVDVQLEEINRGLTDRLANT